MRKIYWLAAILAGLCSCKRSWTERDKTEFLAGCKSRAAADMGEDKARVYCSCMLDKLIRKYPNANDIRFISRDTALWRMGRDCLKQPR